MPILEQELETALGRIRSLVISEREAKGWRRIGLRVWRLAFMLKYQFERDEVGVRAESLAYLMLFSLLPLIAGIFFILNAFAQFAFVKEAVAQFANRFLETIPAEHREFVTDYALQFKDAYLRNVSQRSGQLGIFALAFLAWTGLSAFRNVDRTINYIWGSEARRPFFEQGRNFLVVAVAAPLVLIGALSVPFILRQIPATAFVLERVPFFAALLNWAIPAGLLVLLFYAVYRYVPVRRVHPRAALYGALFTTVLVQLVNLIMNFYFRVGTQTAYGKAAVIPLIAFWIYITWLVIILGAEVSFLAQEGNELTEGTRDLRSLREGQAMLVALSELRDAFEQGRGAVSFEALRESTKLPSPQLLRGLNYLRDRKIVLEARPGPRTYSGDYALACDLDKVAAEPILREFLKIPAPTATSQEPSWEASLEHWLRYFGRHNLGAVVPPRTTQNTSSP